MRAALLLAPLIGCGGSIETPPPFVPQQEPILYLEAEDDPSDGADDSSGLGFHATCTPGQCPELAEGLIGNAYLFDGEDDHLRIAHHERLDTTHGFTIAMWFSLDPSTGQALISRDLGDEPMDDENTYLVLQSIWCSGSDNKLYFATPGTLPLCGEASVAGRQWQHFAATWDGSLKRFYINGQVAANQGTTTVEFDAHDIVIAANDYQDRLGATLTGLVDEVRIYERALEPSEVLSLPGSPSR